MTINGYLGVIDGNGKHFVFTITYEGDVEKIRPLHHHVLHSPDGFCWGYRGSGPADLARSILMDLFGETRATKFYRRFKEEVIANFNLNKPFILMEADIVSWLKGRTSDLP